MSGHRAQNPQRGGQNPRPGRGGPYHGASALSASHFRPSRPPPPNAAALGQFEAASHQYAPAPASNQYPYAPQFGPPGLPPFAQSQTPPIAELVNPTLQFIPPGPPGPHQEEPYDTRNYPLVDSQQPLPLQQSPSPPPRPSSPPTPAVPSSPPPLPSPMPLHPSSPDPDLHEENPHYYSFTGEDGYLAAFLRNFIVHGPKEALACEIELEELELIVAHYFGKLLPTFLEEMSSATDKHEMLKEILTVYAERRSVSRRASGLRMED